MGTVLEVLVTPGVVVAAGAEVVVLESMKMEIPVIATAAGTVHTVHVAVGGQVGEHELLVTLS